MPYLPLAAQDPQLCTATYYSMLGYLDRLPQSRAMWPLISIAHLPVIKQSMVLFELPDAQAAHFLLCQDCQNCFDQRFYYLVNWITRAYFND